MSIPFDADFRADLRGIRFTGEPFRHAPGYYVRTVEGILDGADVTFDKDAGHRTAGIFDVPNRRTEPRTIAFSGFLFDPNLAQLGHKLERLRGLLSEDDDVDTLAWTEFGQRRWARVRRGPGFSARRARGTGRVDYTIRFRASSQFVFGGTHATPAAATVGAVHYGNHAATAMIYVTGTMPNGYKITGPGNREYRVTQALAAGQTHRIDMSTGWLYRDNVLQMEAVSRADVWAIAAGASTSMTLVPVSGVGVMRAETVDTFV